MAHYQVIITLYIKFYSYFKYLLNINIPVKFLKTSNAYYNLSYLYKNIPWLYKVDALGLGSFNNFLKLSSTFLSILLSAIIIFKLFYAFSSFGLFLK